MFTALIGSPFRSNFSQRVIGYYSSAHRDKKNNREISFRSSHEHSFVSEFYLF